MPKPRSAVQKEEFMKKKLEDLSKERMMRHNFSKKVTEQLKNFVDANKKKFDPSTGCAPYRQLLKALSRPSSEKIHIFSESCKADKILHMFEEQVRILSETLYLFMNTHCRFRIH